MGTLFENYPVNANPSRGKKSEQIPTYFDEMFGSKGRVRNPYSKVHDALADMSPEELIGRTEALASSYLAQGVTFDFAGEERPFPLDPVANRQGVNRGTS